ncbi:MAG: CBS domain-containing protein [Isosphaeraceae bacterium]
MATTLGMARSRKTREQGKAADVMTRPVGTCSPASTVTEASLLLRASGGGAVPVVEDGKPVGLVTDRDLAVALAAHPDLPQRPVVDIMSDDVVVVSPETPSRSSGRGSPTGRAAASSRWPRTGTSSA